MHSKLNVPFTNTLTSMLECVYVLVQSEGVLQTIYLFHILSHQRKLVMILLKLLENGKDSESLSN